MRKLAIALVIYATAVACSASTPAATPAPTASPSPVALAPQITPAPVGPPMRVLWAPLQPQPLAVAVRVAPQVGSGARLPALVPASRDQLRNAEREFVDRFAGGFGFFTILQNLRDQNYHGSEEWMFSTTFAPSPFADHARELVATRRENEIRTFHAGTASLENAWVRPSDGLFGGAINVALVEGTIAFTDEVATGGDRTTESHTWRIRALTQGGYLIVDGAEAPAALTQLAPFDPARLDSEVAAQVSLQLHQEEVGPQAMPMSPYRGTAYWDARMGAIDWLHELAARGSLTDRHFESMSARITKFTPTSYLGDGYVTVHLAGTLVEVMNGVRHAYPVNESVVFQRFSFAQPWWMAVDGQNDDGGWIANGDYGVPQSNAHG